MSSNTGTILVYSPNRPAWLAKLRGALVPLGIRLRPVAPEELGQSIGALAGLPDAGVPDAPAAIPIEEPVLILCRFSPQALNTALDRLRRAGVPRPVLKAVLTETNASWSLPALYQELCRERQALSGADAGKKEDSI